jgi:ABC-type dipeptide/oligopeptide/nickel transport system ATPase component
VGNAYELELELTESLLFLSHDRGAAARLADQVVARL